MRDTVLARYENREVGEEVEIAYDPCTTENPLEYQRDWCRFYAVHHRRYRIGHEQMDGESLREVRDELEDGDFIFDVMMYEHSGVAYSLSRGYPFNCPWDSGQCGFVVVTADQAKKELGIDPEDEDARDRIAEQVSTMLKEYTNWCEGSCYYFKRYEVTKCGHCDTKHRDDVESCGGLIADFHDDAYVLSSAGIADEDGNLLEGWVEA